MAQNERQPCDARSDCVWNVRGPGAEPRARWSGRLVGDPLLHVLHGRRVSRVLHFALVRQRGSNRGYANLAVAAVEIGRVAAGIIAGLRRIVLGHLLLRGGTLRNSCCFALGAFRAPSKWRASAAEMRNKSCRIVTFTS